MLLINSPQEDFKGHIDDGSMGGGGPIPYKKTSFYSNIINLAQNKGFDGKTLFGFTQSRKNIYHYTIILSYFMDIYRSTDHLGATVPNKDRICFGYLMFIADEYQKSLGKSKKAWASTFLHELGHSFGLEDLKMPVKYRPRGWKYQTCMYSAPPNDCLNFATYITYSYGEPKKYTIDKYGYKRWDYIRVTNEWNWIKNHLYESIEGEIKL
jgi:hypothetical protein